MAANIHVFKYIMYICILDGILLLRFIEGHAGAIVAKELCAKLFSDYINQFSAPIFNHPHLNDPTRKNNNLSNPTQGSHASTKSTSPGN